MDPRSDSGRSTSLAEPARWPAHRLVGRGLAALLTAFIVSCGGSDNASPAPPPPPAPPANLTRDVTFVTSDSRGTPLAGVRAVHIGGSATASSDAQGRATLNLPSTSVATVSFSKPGLGASYFRVPATNDDAPFEQPVTLLVRQPATQVTGIEAGASINGRHGVRVVFPANGLVDGNGQPVTGTVDMQLTPIDVRTFDLTAIGAPLEGVPAGGSGSAPLVAFGGAEFHPSRNGEKLQIAAGKTATVEFPIYASQLLDGTPLTAGMKLPFWQIDPSTGLWRQESEGDVVQSPDSPSGLAVRATVTHFSSGAAFSPIFNLHNVTLTLSGSLSGAGTSSYICVDARTHAALAANNMLWPRTRYIGCVSARQQFNFGIPPNVPVTARVCVTQVSPGGARSAASGSTQFGGAAGGTSSVTIQLQQTPSVTATITTPPAVAPSTFNAGDQIEIEAEADCPQPQTVQINAGSRTVATFNGAQPVYRTTWDTTGVGIGDYPVIASAVATVGGASQTYTSNPVPLTLQLPTQAPTIVTHVADRSVRRGQPAVFAVEATGGTLEYIWEARATPTSPWVERARGADRTFRVFGTTDQQTGNIGQTGTEVRVRVRNVAGESVSPAGGAARLTVTTDPGGAVAFADAEFPALDWSLQTLTFGPGAMNSTAVRQFRSQNGNPGSFISVELVLDIPAAPTSDTSVHALNWKYDAWYDPSSQGAITSIDVSEDAILLVGRGQGHAAWLALRQNDQLFVCSRVFTPETVWSNKTRTGVTPADCTQLIPGVGSGAAKPDFSAMGAPIQFGFGRAGSSPASAGSGRGSNTTGIDNWSVTVNR